MKVLAVNLLPWYHGLVTSPSSLLRHQHLLPRATLAGRRFFPFVAPKISVYAWLCKASKNRLMGIHWWCFCMALYNFQTPLGTALWASHYYSRCTDWKPWEVCRWSPFPPPPALLSPKFTYESMEPEFGYRVSDSKSKVLYSGLSF